MSLAPNKRFGQHFLRDQQIINRIAGAIIALDDKADQLLEVGPGEGVMTVPLLGHFGQRYHAAEIDTRLQQHLLDSLPLQPSQLLKGDFLKMDMANYFKGSLLLVGNFPYNISSQIVFKIIEDRVRVESMVGMFQKEVAERVLQEIDASDLWSDPIVTEISPLENYYVAEEYHQQYYENNSSQPYCSVVIAPKLKKMRSEFKDWLKE